MFAINLFSGSHRIKKKIKEVKKFLPELQDHFRANTSSILHIFLYYALFLPSSLGVSWHVGVFKKDKKIVTTPLFYFAACKVIIDKEEIHYTIIYPAQRLNLTEQSWPDQVRTSREHASILVNCSIIYHSCIRWMTLCPTTKKKILNCVELHTKQACAWQNYSTFNSLMPFRWSIVNILAHGNKYCVALFNADSDYYS